MWDLTNFKERIDLCVEFFVSQERVPTGELTPSKLRRFARKEVRACEEMVKTLNPIIGDIKLSFLRRLGRLDAVSLMKEYAYEGFRFMKAWQRNYELSKNCVKYHIDGTSEPITPDIELKNLSEKFSESICDIIANTKVDGVRYVALRFLFDMDRLKSFAIPGNFPDNVCNMTRIYLSNYRVELPTIC